MPLLIALHGGGGTGQNMVKLTMGGFDEISDKSGFIVVYLDGIEKHWNDGRSNETTRYRINKKNIDDVGFITALIGHLIKEMNVDPKRVYVTGMSNGAIIQRLFFYIVEGGGHTWPDGYQYLNERIIGKTSRDINAIEVIRNFFEKHSL